MTASSPMTEASHPSVSSDALPTLTTGTTAPTSPSPLSPLSRSPSLSPAPEDSSSFVKKRKAPASETKQPKKKAKGKENATPTKKETKAKDDKPEKGTYCHQCRTKIEPENVLRCTKLRKYTKGTPPRACNLAFCERDLVKRYEVDPDAVRKRAHNVPATELAKHDADKDYVFACPCCVDECQNSTCRIKKGLQPLGDVVKMAAEQGVTPLQLVAQINADGPEPTTKSRVDMSDEFDGELSDPDAPKASTSKTTPKKKVAKKAEPEKGKAKVTPKKNAKETARGKAKKGKEKEAPKKAAAKAKEAPKAKPDPPRFVWPKCDPPVIANIDTRMSREEAEQRMYLREFVCRFRHLLGLPDRSLGPLDDLEHPLSEATVRQIAGAFLGLIAGEGLSQYYLGEYEPEVLPQIEDLREDMRYADLGRFAQIYNQAADMLGLKLPPDPTQAAKERNERAMRALLDLGADEPAPSWAMETAGPSRRAGASRLPQPAEVVRMLLALADFVTNIDIVRFNMDPNVLYAAGDAIRTMSNGQKAEQKRWEGEKAKLNAAKVRCKNAAETKAARAKFAEMEKEHFMRGRMFMLDYRAGLARKAMRFEPLGVDLDGRVYYSLTARQIEEERYRPSFWARGVLIWGRGWGQEDDEVPNLVERWMIVNNGEDLRALSSYLAYRWRTAYDEMEQAAKLEAEKTEAAKKKGGKKTPLNRTPSRNGAGPGRSTPAQRRASTNGRAIVNGDDSDSDSDLSSPPEDDLRELLEQLDPPGYTPSMDKIKEDQFKLETAVQDVAMFVEALEWKGIR